MKSILAVQFLCLVLAGCYAVNGARTEAKISEATAFCEKAVPEHCMITTCPQYCNAIRSAKGRTNCNAECTSGKRCKLRPTVGNDDPKNVALDEQNRDQLWACIAEKRDPNANKTGRRTTPWQQIEAASFKKAIRP